MMKTFEDLVFMVWPQLPESQKNAPIPEHEDARQAIMHFENGYGISVLKGDIFYSNGTDTYEVDILHNGELCYDTPITNDVIRYVTSEQITDIMKRIQELKD